MAIIEQLKSAWNAFTNKDPTEDYQTDFFSRGFSYSRKPDRPRLSMGNETSIIAPVYNRIATDVASIDILHVNLDKEGNFLSKRKSGINDCLTFNPNLDQTPFSFKQDIVLSLCDEGTVAICPIDTTSNPTRSYFDIQSMRVCKIVEWSPRQVKCRAYNERLGKYEEIWFDKTIVAILENPFYNVMNQPNSTLKRLIYKLNLLDSIDAQSSSGKMDLIIQLPYVVRSEARRKEAEKRSKDIELQLTGSKYGIAYIDGTEKVTQLNRPVENNLMKQVEYLTSMLYSQIGITEDVMKGTADEKTMLNYYTNSVEPFLTTIVEGMRKAWVTKTGRSQGQSIIYLRNAFKLVPVSQLAEIADKFTRNEIVSSNEFRSVIGYKPSSDPRADKLINKNIAQSNEDPNNGVTIKKGDTNDVENEEV